MSRVLAFIADLHIANHRQLGGPWRGGINRRGLHTTDAFGNALSFAESHDATRMVILGDVFDGVRPEPQLIAQAQQMINAHGGMQIRIIKGNHDSCSSELGDHALGPLGELSDVMVYEKPAIECVSSDPALPRKQPRFEIFYVPFEPGPASEWLPKRVTELHPVDNVPGTVRVLCIHLGIYDQAMLTGASAHWIKQADDAVSLDLLARVCFEHGITAVFAGNWHGRHVWNVSDPASNRKVTVVQVGALCPTGWDNPGLYGYGGVTLATFGDNGELTNLIHPQVPGPRFVNVTDIAQLGDLIAQSKVAFTQLYVRASCKPDDVSYFASELTKLRDAGEIEAFDVRTDKTDAQVQARAAAEAARSTTTMEAVLEAFVTKMPMPEGVDRERVFNRAKGYLE